MPPLVFTLTICAPLSLHRPTNAVNPFGNGISLAPCDCHTVGAIIQASLLAVLDEIPEFPIPPEV
jgi:hypothetical protein